MKQYLLLLFVHQSASALFRFIGSAGRNMIVANTFGLFALLLLFALGGFVLARGIRNETKHFNLSHDKIVGYVSSHFIGDVGDVKSWWLWGYWSSPLMYAQNAILVNEFTGHSWSKVSIHIHLYE